MAAILLAFRVMGLLQPAKNRRIWCRFANDGGLVIYQWITCRFSV